MKVIILAAGIGSRLGKPFPKPLTMLDNGLSIMKNQLKALLRYVDINDIYVIVGFKKELIMEAFPELTYVYNDYFDTTNTSKSLVKGLEKLKGHDVIWINGDVVLDHEVIGRVFNYKNSCMAVNTERVAEEEVKYTVNDLGAINQVSKEVKNALGEAVGVNKITKENLPLFIEQLRVCKEQDYFEKGIELSIGKGLNIYPVDISELLCREVDFIEDLDLANKEIAAGLK
jgi:L-glutamine-phosphate cytidylyltransferase